MEARGARLLDAGASPAGLGADLLCVLLRLQCEGRFTTSTPPRSRMSSSRSSPPRRPSGDDERVPPPARRAGREVRPPKLDLTKSHHYKLTAPGKPVVFASSSTSDPVRALKNTEALLKKMDGKDKS
jgi:hypothetical protein